MLVVFSLAKPDTFPTYFNFRSIIANKSVQALMALAVLLPMTANQFDLSAGYLLGLSQVLVIGLQAQGLGWVEASLIMVLLGAVVGLANGILVTVVGIDSFIATLGTGTLLYGLSQWYTGGQQVVANLPDSFIGISGAPVRRPPARHLCARGQRHAVDRLRVPAGRPVSLRSRCQPARGGTQRHLGQALSDGRLRCGRA